MSQAGGGGARQTLQSGRQTAGAMLSAAQADLQKVFIVAVVGLMGTIYLLRRFVWEMLKRDLFARMGPDVRNQTEVVAITPFDVILLQVKIGIVVGILLAIPVFLWFSRDALRKRGWWPAQRVARWKLAVIVLLGAVLLAGGVSYAYFLFFPLMFDFLATNAVNVGFKPTYSIVKWAQFIFLLTISFGLAAQLPLVMSALSYTGIVKYETFRDKWRYAVLGIFIFGALFSPPDPFTQIMWAVPLIILYAFSLQMAKLVVITKRSSAEVDAGAVVRARWNIPAGVAFVSFVGVYAFFTRGGVAAINRGLARLPAAYQRQLPTLGQATGLSNEVAAAIVAAVVALVVTGIVVFALVVRALGEADRASFGETAAPASAGAPGDIDISELTAGGVDAAPPQVFQQMTEDESLALAREAMDADDPEKARAILDRFDEAQEQAEAEQDAETAAEAAGAAAGATEAAGGQGGESEGNTATKTAAGMMNAFTEDETTEDDIGGYYYDVAFILQSLTSKAFRLVAVFMAVLGGSFVWLYQGGIRRIKDTFFSQMPAALQPDVEIVTLHPVEALIFEIKFSTLLAIVATLPLVLYYAWPALKERGIVRGDPRVMLVWGGSLVVGIIGGSIVGFLYVAPAVISWLAADAIQANMVIAYRINNFGWLVIYTTVGIGLLAEIPVSMVLFHLGGVLSYHTMLSYWRQVVVGVFVASALLSPRGVFTMLLMALPATFAFLLGLFVLWVITFGGRRGRPKPEEAVAD